MKQIVIVPLRFLAWSAPVVVPVVIVGVPVAVLALLVLLAVRVLS